ncbi:MAG: hypothetical protein JKX85_05650, partial [Phycisphaeraceae bacterium]|nr:hypothetical protein [Phycisphaeraceae bacterium]
MMMSYISIIGFVVVGITGMQALLIVIDTFKRSTHAQLIREQDTKLFALRVEAARKRVLVSQEKHLQWAGSRKFEIKRKVHEDPNADICSFYLAPHDGRAIPTF